MEPFFFGPAERQLYGCYHAPAAASRGCAVLLCQPLGHEYIQFHRALQRLAVLLADAGFPVLRFDFRGCGDSAGELKDGSLAAWREDVAEALGELRRRSAAPRITLAGLRLGGSLAAIVASERDDIDSVVLWDPVLNGRAYLEELTRSHERMLRYAHVRPRPEEMRREILGFELPDGLIAELGHLHLLGAVGLSSKRVLIVESNRNADQSVFRDHLAAQGAVVKYERANNPHLWVWIEDFGKVHVPRKIIRGIVQWLTEACS